MKRHIRFSDEASAYRFVLVGEESTVFEIDKGTLTFNEKAFYELFFRGLTEKPSYELVLPADDLKEQAKHVFDTVQAIFQKTCRSIDEAWFTPNDAKEHSPENLEGQAF